MEAFNATFGVIFRAMVQLMLIGVLAGFLVRRKWIAQDQIRALAAVTVNVLLPAMMFSNIVKQFNPGATPGWWALPILGVGVSSAGMLMAWLLFRRELPQKKLMLAMAALQNSGYMALPIGKMAFPDQFDRFALFTFLFILGYNPFLWSVGKRLATTGGQNGEPGGWRAFVTPPFVANVTSVLLVLFGVARWIPAVVVESADMLGSATVAMATFVLGATVGGVALTRMPPWSDAVRAIGVKLALLPALMVTVLAAISAWTALRIEPLLGHFLVIQAASAPATALALQVRKYGGDEQRLGPLMLLSYGLCLVTLPLWLALWGMLSRV